MSCWKLGMMKVLRIIKYCSMFLFLYYSDCVNIDVYDVNDSN